MRLLLSLLLLLALGTTVQANGSSRWWNLFCPGRLSLPLCCPDDYQCKLQPELSPAFCPCGKDDYQAKVKPCLPPDYKPCGGDDYQGKPRPVLPCDTPGQCLPTDSAPPKPKCWWLQCPWWGPRLCK